MKVHDAPPLTATTKVRSQEHEASKVHPFEVTWRERVAVLGGVGALLVFGFLLGKEIAPRETLEVLGLLPVTFVAVGKFLPLWGVSGQSSLGPYELGLVIWGLDTLTVVVFVYSFEAFYKLRPLRKALDKLYTNMSLVLKVYPSMKRASVVGVFLFVLFPVSGTGALGASVIGALLGMERRVVMATVSAGGLVGGLLMAALADNSANALLSLKSVQNNPSSKYWISAGLILILMAIVVLLGRAFRRALERASAE
ncbi:MAG: small multi-drug export protein [Myxococcales bacterium]|nr:small multi-drug export protein [Myxococcales bacterium]